NGHRGPAHARNVAFREARGEFVVMLDADDTFHPQRLEALAEAAAFRPDLDILTTDALVEVDGQVRRRYYDVLEFEVRDQRRGIIERDFIFALAAIRRDALLQVGTMDESLHGHESWELWFRMIFAGSHVGLVDEPLASYRRRGSSLSTQRETFLEDRLR